MAHCKSRDVRTLSHKNRAGFCQVLLDIAVGSALSYLEYVGQGVEQVEPGVDGLLRSRLHPSELLSLLHPVLSGIQGELPSLCPSPSCARPLNLQRKSYSYSWFKKI